MKALTGGVSLAVRLAVPVLMLGACANSAGSPELEEDPLTSLSALQRSLTFQGKVYVRGGTSDADILTDIRAQTKTAFGALRNVNVGVNNRELATIEPGNISKRNVAVVSAGMANVVPMVEVQYTYVDKAVVPKSMATRTSIPLAVLRPDYASQAAKVLVECTKNDAEAREFSDALWYVFHPALPSCNAARQGEADSVQRAQDALLAPVTQVSAAEVARLYRPMTVSLAAADTNTRAIYPEYERLYAGGAEAGVLNIGVIQGLESHSSGPAYLDGSYRNFHWILKAMFNARAGFRYVRSEPAAALDAVNVRGTRVPILGFTQLMDWEVTRSPTGLPSGISAEDVRAAGAEQILGRWHIFEAPVSVTTRGVAAARIIRIHAYFGDSSTLEPYARALRNHDVVVYNGHSYIGRGPLDPVNFTAAGLSAGYQLLLFNSCVSYNYYEKDYFALKVGGTRNLDMITNGLESPAWDSGRTLGRMLGALIDGRQNSYQELLKAGQLPYPTAPGGGRDALRVVDGELDNVYAPLASPITVAPR